MKGLRIQQEQDDLHHIGHEEIDHHAQEEAAHTWGFRACGSLRGVAAEAAAEEAPQNGWPTGSGLWCAGFLGAVAARCRACFRCGCHNCVYSSPPKVGVALDLALLHKDPFSAVYLFQREKSRGGRIWGREVRAASHWAMQLSGRVQGIALTDSLA